MLLGAPKSDRLDEVIFDEIPFAGRPLEVVVAGSGRSKTADRGKDIRHGFKLLDENGKVMSGVFTEDGKTYGYIEGEKHALEGVEMNHLRVIISPRNKAAIYTGTETPPYETALTTGIRPGKKLGLRLATTSVERRTTPARGVRLVLFCSGQQRLVRYVVVRRLREWPANFPAQR
jgi:hypothetical protein